MGKRAVLESANLLMRSKRAKRIPPDVHRRKRIRNNRKLNHNIRLSSDKFMKNHKKSLNMKRSQEKHLRALHGRKYDLDKNIDLDSVKQELSRESGAVERRHKPGDDETLKQRVQKRLRQKHRFHQK